MLKKWSGLFQSPDKLLFVKRVLKKILKKVPKEATITLTFFYFITI